MTLGGRLRDLRVNGDPYRNQREAARAMGVDWPTWSHFEFDRERPPRDLIPRIAAFFGADLAELLRLWDQWTEAPPIDLSRSVCSGRRAR